MKISLISLLRGAFAGATLLMAGSAFAVENTSGGECGDGICNSVRETTTSCPADCRPPAPTPTLCGNKICEVGESSSTCVADCPRPETEQPRPTQGCGNLICEVSESAQSCPTDCDVNSAPSSCGNKICETRENTLNCPGDCQASQTPTSACGGAGQPSCDPLRIGTNGRAMHFVTTEKTCPVGFAIASVQMTDRGPLTTCKGLPTTTRCGNGYCETGENIGNCPADCPVTCGDGQCDVGETWQTCQLDCSCGNGICEAAKGETVATCLTDCHCGNGICEAALGENFATCAGDCPAANCPSSTISWGTNCSGTAPATNAGNSAAVTNNAPGYTGSANASCTNGTFAVQAGATCSAQSCNTGAAPGSRTWNGVAGSCTGVPPANQTIASGGVVTYTENASPTREGSAQYRCNAGVISNTIEPGATCISTVNGQCGTANGTSRATAPSGGALCTRGTASAVTTTATSYNWGCAGTASGSNATCSATRLSPTNGACGTATTTGPYTSTPPGSTLCASGTASAVTDSGPGGNYSWTCPGTSGGTTASCSVRHAANCSANAGATRSWTVGAQTCGATGHGSAVSGATVTVNDRDGRGSASFTCTDGTLSSSANAGATCAAQQPGICGGDNGATFTPTQLNNRIAAGQMQYCASGAVSNITSTPAGAPTTHRWDCEGTLGSTVDAIGCSATVDRSGDGLCGTSHQETLDTQPAGAALCSRGTASAVSPNANGWNWNCDVPAPNQSASCGAFRAASCATNGVARSWSVGPNNCSGTSGAGTVASGNRFTIVADLGSGSAEYTCSNGVIGSSPDNATCTSGPITGACGAAESGTYATAPNASLCQLGTASVVQAGADGIRGDNWNWTCNGLHGGGQAICAAARRQNCTTDGRTVNWTAGGRSCTGVMTNGDSVSNGSSATVTDTTGGDQGTAQVACVDGAFAAGASPGATCTATAVNGTCGTATGVGTVNPPSGASLCATGSATAVTTAGSVHRWTCNGINGGANSPLCQAPRWRQCQPGPVTWSANGATCNGNAPLTEPTTTATVNNTTPGAIGTGVFNCTTGGSFSASPSSTCSSTATGCAAGSIVWGGGQCQAAVPELANGGTFSASNAADGFSGNATAVCTNGVLGTTGAETCESVTNPCSTSGVNRTWTVGGNTCQGTAANGSVSHGSTVLINAAVGSGTATFACSNGVVGSSPESATCNAGAQNGVCDPSATGTATSLPPSGTLCSSGAASSVSTNPTTYDWMCAGVNGGTGVSCSAPRRAACSTTAATGSRSWTVSGQNCAGPVAAGQTVQHGQTVTVTSTNGQAGTASFTCNDGTVGGTANPGATCSAGAVNGMCGSAQTGGSVAAPNSSLCNAGTASVVTSGAATHNWTCNGQNGGSTSSCSKPRWYECPANSAFGWTVGGVGCTANLGTAQPNTTVTAPTNAPNRSGSATINCGTDGQRSVQAGATCVATNNDCTSPVTLDWSVSGQSCQATVGGLTHNQTTTVTNSLATSQGQATVQCTNGSITVIGSPPATCAPANNNCPGGTLATWGSRCSATTPALAHNATQVVPSTSADTTGQATFRCVNGVSSMDPGASCVSTRPCAGSTTVTWGGSCSAVVDAQSHNTTSTVTNSAPSYSGSAEIQCFDGARTVSATSCTATPPAQCGGTVSWSEGGNSCSGSAPVTNQGGSVSVTSTNGNSGSASFTCGTSGTFQVQNGATCTPPIATCSSQSVTWTSPAGRTCSGVLPVASQGQTVTATNSTAGFQGKYSATCSGGSFTVNASSCFKDCGDTYVAFKDATPSVNETWSYNDCGGGNIGTDRMDLDVSLNPGFYNAGYNNACAAAQTHARTTRYIEHGGYWRVISGYHFRNSSTGGDTNNYMTRTMVMGCNDGVLTTPSDTGWVSGLDLGDNDRFRVNKRGSGVVTWQHVRGLIYYPTGSCFSSDGDTRSWRADTGSQIPECTASAGIGRITNPGPVVYTDQALICSPSSDVDRDIGGSARYMCEDGVISQTPVRDGTNNPTCRNVFIPFCGGVIP